MDDDPTEELRARFIEGMANGRRMLFTLHRMAALSHAASATSRCLDCIQNPVSALEVAPLMPSVSEFAHEVFRVMRSGFDKIRASGTELEIAEAESALCEYDRIADAARDLF